MRPSSRISLVCGGILMLGGIGYLAVDIARSVLSHNDWFPMEHLVESRGERNLLRFEVSTAEGVVFWAIENAEASGLRTLDYGVVPEGFRQLVPGSGAPAPLVEGEHLWATLCDDSASGGFFAFRRGSSGSLERGVTVWSHSGYSMELCTQDFAFDGWAPVGHHDSAN